MEHVGPPLSIAAIAVVAVHGRGQSPVYLVEHLVEPLVSAGVGDIAWLLPAAPENTWYPNSFLAPLADNQPSLDRSLATLADLAIMLAGRDPLTVVWCGFSQGACLISEFLAHRPQRWGGAVLLTGGMIGPEGTELEVAGSFDSMPTYFATGDTDEWVPEWRVHETADAFRRAGAEVTVDVFPGRPHEISDVEREQTRAMLNSLRPQV